MNLAVQILANICSSTRNEQFLPPKVNFMFMSCLSFVKRCIVALHIDYFPGGYKIGVNLGKIAIPCKYDRVPIEYKNAQ